MKLPYLIRIPKWIQQLYAGYLWQVNTHKKELFLTFDDGPTPNVTSFVLDTLKEFNTKATFFCIGKNVKENPLLFQRIIEEGHAVGNHTNHHLNGWRTDVSSYVNDVFNAQNELEKQTDLYLNLFRPPYGKITKRQANKLQENKFKIIMWSLLSGDFDVNITAEKCYQNCIKTIKKGDIIVFHDSLKSYKKLKIVLPKILLYYQKKGYVLKKL